MTVQLKVLVGSTAGQVLKVKGPKFYIGRSEDCHLRPRSDLISRHHCAIIIEDGYVAIRDFGSKNGTYVNGERVSSEQELAAGDHIKVGPLEFEVIFNFDSLGGEKKPKVGSIREAAARTADSGSGVIEPGSSADDMDISEWLGEDLMDDETREMPGGETAEVTLAELTGDDETRQPPESKEGESEQSDAGKESGSDDAAAEVLKRLRRLR